MKLIWQFVIILAFSFVGEALHALVPLPVPASIYGIVLLFLALQFRIVKASDIAETSSFLIEIMPVLFVPAAVGVLQSWGVVRDNWLAYLSIMILSTIIVMAVSGWTTQLIIRNKNKRNSDR